VQRNTLCLRRSHLAYRDRLQSSLVVTPRNVHTAIAHIAKGEAAIPIDILILLKYFAQSLRQSLPPAARVRGCKERPATQRQNDDSTSSVKFQRYVDYEHFYRRTTETKHDQLMQRLGSIRGPNICVEWVAFSGLIRKVPGSYLGPGEQISKSGNF
jgi:hypothetical protein